MSKALLADEVLKAINMHHDDIDCTDQYKVFMEDLAELLAKHAGGKFSKVTDDEFGSKMFVHFLVDECVPSDGGVYKHFDKDTIWKDGVEI
jgi:hypothetical protein